MDTYIILFRFCKFQPFLNKNKKKIGTRASLGQRGPHGRPRGPDAHGQASQAGDPPAPMRAAAQAGSSPCGQGLEGGARARLRSPGQRPGGAVETAQPHAAQADGQRQAGPAKSRPLPSDPSMAYMRQGPRVIPQSTRSTTTLFL